MNQSIFMFEHTPKLIKVQMESHTLWFTMFLKWHYPKAGKGMLSVAQIQNFWFSIISS